MTLAAPAASLDPELAISGDVTQFWRVPRYRGLDCLHARFNKYSYARHTHETYAIAAIVEGCETFFHRGEQHYAPVGSVGLICPDELHDGAPHGGAFAYRTFYPSPELMLEIAEDVAGRTLSRPPWFSRSVVHDPDLARSLARLQASLCLDGGRTPLIEQDSRLVEVLSKLVARWADLDGHGSVGRETSGIRRAKEFLDAHLSSDVELAEVARVAGLSRSHFIRAFRKEVGLTPHAYLVDRRFRKAMRLLGQGVAPGDVAAACGFFDQSHLNRVFKARMAVTPGAYRAAAA
jgi:AraC-like DNA-binding protein